MTMGKMMKLIFETNIKLCDFSSAYNNSENSKASMCIVPVTVKHKNYIREVKT